MFLRCITSTVSKLWEKNRRNVLPLGIRSCNFHATSAIRQKKGKSKANSGSHSRNAQDANTLKIINPQTCQDSTEGLLDPLCNVAVVVGGANGFGFAAADHLLCKGARSVVVIDDGYAEGSTAAERLCDTYGKDRAQFLQCDLRNMCQFEATLQQALCKHKEIRILFNDLDKEKCPARCDYKSEPNLNHASKAIRAGMKIIGRQNGGPGGIIVNCASILGFMDWPQDPFPVYCMKESAIETTMDLTKEYNVDETGVRLVALCPINKSFAEIGLPAFPDRAFQSKLAKKPCIPSSTWRIGSALSYVLAWAKNGSTWVVEPSTSPYQVPRLVHFPEKEGDKIDPKVYETQMPCAVGSKPPCIDVSNASSQGAKACEACATKKK